MVENFVRFTWPNFDAFFLPFQYFPPVFISFHLVFSRVWWGIFFDPDWDHSFQPPCELQVSTAFGFMFLVWGGRFE